LYDGYFSIAVTLYVKLGLVPPIVATAPKRVAEDGEWNGLASD